MSNDDKTHNLLGRMIGMGKVPIALVVDGQRILLKNPAREDRGVVHASPNDPDNCDHTLFLKAEPTKPDPFEETRNPKEWVEICKGCGAGRSMDSEGLSTPWGSVGRWSHLDRPTNWIAQRNETP